MSNRLSSEGSHITDITLPTHVPSSHSKRQLRFVTLPCKQNLSVGCPSQPQPCPDAAAPHSVMSVLFSVNTNHASTLIMQGKIKSQKKGFYLDVNQLDQLRAFCRHSCPHLLAISQSDLEKGQQSTDLQTALSLHCYRCPFKKGAI